VLVLSVDLRVLNSNNYFKIIKAILYGSTLGSIVMDVIPYSRYDRVRVDLGSFVSWYYFVNNN